MCRLTVDGEIKQFSCKMDVPPRLWDVKNGRAMGKSVEAMQINLAVDKIRDEVNRRYQELMQSDGYVTAVKLRDAYRGIGVKQETLTVDIAALQARREAVQTDYNAIDEQRRKKLEELAKAETELAQTRREIKTDKLKGVAVDATTKAVERIGALFHDPKPAQYEKQIADLRDVIEGKDRDIKSLQR